MRRNGRPVFLDLRAIRMPPGAVASILHRISGLLLFLAIPGLLWVLERSLAGPEGYATVHEAFGSWPVRLALVLLLWGLTHHLLAGLRFLLMDLGAGHALAAARASARVVTAAGLLGLAVAAWGLLA